MAIKKSELYSSLWQGCDELRGSKWEVKILGDLFDFSGGYSASCDQLSTKGYCWYERLR